MKTKYVVSIVVAVITTTGAIVSSAIAIKLQNKIDDQNQYIQSNLVNVVGNDNEVTINNIKDLVEGYNKLMSENETLKAQNSQYFKDYTEQKNINDKVTAQLSDKPNVEFEDLALCINGIDIPVNSKKSKMIVDGKNYIAEEFLKGFVADDQSFTEKNGTLFVGKVIAEKSSLFKQFVNSSNNVETKDIATDSFGNTYSNVLYFYNDWNHNITYALNNKYSYISLNFAMSDEALADRHGTLVIKADDEVIYTRDSLNKKVEPFNISLPINNCSLLTIDFQSDLSCQCIISDAVVYNE